MTSTDKLFAGSIPEIYDRYLVPLIFEDFAAVMARRITALAPAAILETAAGTGVLTRALSPLLPSSSYVATDLNGPMLERARARQGAGEITWQVVDAQALPFDAASFDAVCCQFGVMFFPDRVGAYREARRVLKPGGTFVLSVWDRIEENVLARDVSDALAEIFPGDPPRFLARTPHGYHDCGEVRRDLEAAGFTAIDVETVSAMSRADSAAIPAIGFCRGSPLANELMARCPDGLDAVTAQVRDALAKRHGEAEIAGKARGFIYTART